MIVSARDSGRPRDAAIPRLLHAWSSKESVDAPELAPRFDGRVRRHLPKRAWKQRWRYHTLSATYTYVECTCRAVFVMAQSGHLTQDADGWDAQDEIEDGREHFRGRNIHETLEAAPLMATERLG